MATVVLPTAVYFLFAVAGLEVARQVAAAYVVSALLDWLSWWRRLMWNPLVHSCLRCFAYGQRRAGPHVDVE